MLQLLLIIIIIISTIIVECSPQWPREQLNLTPNCGLNYILSSSEWSFHKSELAHIRYIETPTWLCGFRVKIAIFFKTPVSCNSGGDSHMKQTGMLVVSLRVFRAKRQYFKPPRSRLGFREELEIYDNAFKNYFAIKAFDDYVFISLKLIACRICVFLSGLF